MQFTWYKERIKVPRYLNDKVESVSIATQVLRSNVPEAPRELVAVK
jgi:hypothetical protein